MPALTDEDKVIRNDVGKRIAAAIESLSAPEAEKVSYDNTESGMTADNTQDAIDELKSDIDSVKLEDLDDVNLTSPQDEDELHYDSATSKWKNIAKKIYEKSASGSLVSFNDGGDNIPLKSLIANITAVQSGSGTPSPSNVRAISGWNGINVSRTGKNIFDFTRFATEYPSYCSMNGDVLEITPASILFNTGISVAFPTKTIYISVKIKCGTASNVRLRFMYSDGSTGETSGVSSTDTWTTVTAATDSTKRIVSIRLNWSNSGTFEIKDLIMSFESNPTYEPYNGTQITLPFGQTVYGGTLNVLSGVLTVTHGYVDLGSLSWDGPDTSSIFYASISGMKIPASAAERRTGIMCSIYPVSSGTSINSSMDNKSMLRLNGNLYIRDTSYSDSTTFTSAVTGQTLVYELATPVTYQLTTAQVSTLLGLNNIFADTGDISLSYFTQNANAINDVAESNTRTALNTDVPKTDLTDIFVTGTKNNTGSTIAAGTYFYVNGQLALCKSAISANADLTLNTNYELVTAGVLNKLVPYSTAVLEAMPANTTKTYTIPSSIYSMKGVYILALGSSYGAGGVYILMVAGVSTRDTIIINTVVNTQYATVTEISATQFSITASGAEFIPCLTRIA